MKKPFRSSFLIGILFITSIALLAETLVVKIQTTQLRKEPQFFSPPLISLKAGDRLEKLGEQEGWVNVRTADGLLGWVHSSAVEARKFNLMAIDKKLNTQASANEVALAGKGFNKQVEENYRAKHTEVSFIWVDRMLQVKVSSSQLEDFLKRGKLGEFRGSK